MSLQSRRNISRNRQTPYDTLRPHDSICPWCGNPDRRPKKWKNGTPEARRLVKRGLALIDKKRIVVFGRPLNNTVTRCAHLCHWI